MQTFTYASNHKRGKGYTSNDFATARYCCIFCIKHLTLRDNRVVCDALCVTVSSTGNSRSLNYHLGHSVDSIVTNQVNPILFRLPSIIHDVPILPYKAFSDNRCKSTPLFVK